jgi:hypothetical protein
VLGNRKKMSIPRRGHIDDRVELVNITRFGKRLKRLLQETKLLERQGFSTVQISSIDRVTNPAVLLEDHRSFARVPNPPRYLKRRLRIRTERLLSQACPERKGDYFPVPSDAGVPISAKVKGKSQGCWPRAHISD